MFKKKKSPYDPGNLSFHTDFKSKKVRLEANPYARNESYSLNYSMLNKSIPTSYLCKSAQGC